MSGVLWKRQMRRWLLVLFFLISVRYFPATVEVIYATGIYRILRTIDLFFLRWLPFSAGDFLYLFFLPWWLKKAYRIYVQTRSWPSVALFVSNWMRKILLWFYLLWGLNYFRMPLHRQMHLNISPVSVDRLETLALREADSLNLLHSALQGVDSAGVFIPYDFDRMRETAATTYRSNSKFFPRFSETYYVVKPSMFSGWVSYMGVLGYLNPFTHESQINVRYPAVFLPHVMLHELAHQIGYADETEAEFIGYVEGVKSADPYFRYASHLVALQYLLMDIRKSDPSRFEELKKRLRPGILADYRKQREFILLHHSRFDTSKAYDVYLKLNQKGRGLESYSQMVIYLSAYLQ